MPRRTLFLISGLLLASGALLLASRANGNPRLEKLYGQFIVPCCWAETLLNHSSPLADQMRGEIVRWVAEGKTDEQIKSVFVERYTMRVLAMPEGARLEWLVWTPIAVTACGMLALFALVRRLRSASVTDDAATAALPDIDESEWDAK